MTRVPFEYGYSQYTSEAMAEKRLAAMEAKIEQLEAAQARASVLRTSAKLAAKDAEIERLRALLDAKTTPGYELLATTIEKQAAEIELLRALLKRHDDLCRKDEAAGRMDARA